jgi:hypothetical protein
MDFANLFPVMPQGFGGPQDKGPHPLGGYFPPRRFLFTVVCCNSLKLLFVAGLRQGTLYVFYFHDSHCALKKKSFQDPDGKEQN